MDPTSLLPVPDVLPAPWPIFEVLELLLFTIHILLINILLGSTVVFLFSRKGDQLDSTSFRDKVAGKLPTIFAFAVTIGVAPLLFVQVVYGHLFYSSSVLMAWWWIAIVPILILIYGSLYLRARSPKLATAGMVVAVLGFLYVGLMYVNNFSMMQVPETWHAFFANRGGTHLNLADATVLPRYLHFLAASVAVGGLFLAWLASRRDDSPTEVNRGLNLFAYATIGQILIGFWWLIALPREIMFHFMGERIVHTILLMLGILLAIGSLVTALRHKVRPTLIQFLLLLVTMTILRALLRGSYIGDFFRPGQMELVPQYGVFALFLVVLLAGLGAIGWMLKAVRAAQAGGTKA